MLLPAKVEKVLNDYINLFHQYFPNTLVGLYLHGSIAQGAYVDNSSDIDFIAITNRRLTELDAPIIKQIHNTIATKYPIPELDGVYIIKEDIGIISHEPIYLYYNDGEMGYGEYFNFNPITWWVLKNQGFDVVGPPVNTFQFNVSPQQLVSYVRENMNSYWAGRIRRFEYALDQIVNLPIQQIYYEVEWTVLGLLRQFFTIKNQDVIPKLDAGEYGLIQLPEEWHPIIQEAIEIRKGQIPQYYHTNEERIQSVIAFAKYLIHHCNHL